MNIKCPACFMGIHAECIGKGCYCMCQMPDPVEQEHDAREACQQFHEPGEDCMP